MSSRLHSPTPAPGRMPIGDAVDRLVRGGLPLRFTAYDGSAAGPTRRRASACTCAPSAASPSSLTAPGDLGLVRAYVSGDLDLTGVHPGDPYDALVVLKDNTRFRVPAPTEALQLPLSRPGAPAPAHPAPAGTPAAVAAGRRGAEALDGP